jgi:hypothetical protein
VSVSNTTYIPEGGWLAPVVDTVEHTDEIGERATRLISAVSIPITGNASLFPIFKKRIPSPFVPAGGQVEGHSNEDGMAASTKVTRFAYSKGDTQNEEVKKARQVYTRIPRPVLRAKPATQANPHGPRHNNLLCNLSYGGKGAGGGRRDASVAINRHKTMGVGRLVHMGNVARPEMWNFLHGTLVRQQLLIRVFGSWRIKQPLKIKVF